MAAGKAKGPLRDAAARIRELLDQPLASFLIIASATLALVLFGHVMVLSAASVGDYAAQGSSYDTAMRQIVALAVALPVVVIAVLVPKRIWLRFAWPIMIGAVLFQFTPLIPGLGVSAGGNDGWITIGFTTLQPAEFAKVALALWLGAVLARSQTERHTWRAFWLPAGGYIVMLGAIMLASRDLGTVLILVVIGAGAMFVAGLPLRMFASMAIVMAIGIAYFAVSSINRLRRIQAMLVGRDDDSFDPTDTHWQGEHGMFALASGGWTGRGLGASREKWGWLPAAHNDYIFAIIGEELGALGALTVLLLFVVLGYGMLRIIRRSDDVAIKVATAGVFTWIVGQGAINIAVVVQLAPVIGVPLPLVSSGGSALMSTLLGIGMVLSFSLHEAGGPKALKPHVDRFREAVSVVARRPGRNG